MRAGAIDNGRPGLRAPGYYAAFVALVVDGGLTAFLNLSGHTPFEG